jgi:proline dehydrogenase
MAGLFASTLRPAIMAASRREGLRRATERLPVTRSVVHRFVPGATIESALDSVAALRESGRYVSIDYLGEDVSDVDDADAAVQTYLDLIERLGRSGDPAGDGIRPLEVSVKLSALGQSLDRDGEKIARENAWSICDAARRAGVWVTVDAETHTGDCKEFAASGARIRLCKGAYDEPASVAHRDPAEVTDSYLACLRVLMDGSGNPMVASHDPAIIDAVPGMVRESGRGTTDFEYQMLYGIRDNEQRRLAAAGNHVRVYVPFGTQWYGYFMRRLAERPANLTFFLRALAERGH